MADYCVLHGEENCAAPDCYACGNHDLDEHGRCSDRRCGALTSPEIVELLAGVGRTAPIELKRFLVGRFLAERMGVM
jgi:hypothetical protein